MSPFRNILDRDAQADAQALESVPPLSLELKALDALVVLGQLQLALRHPANKGASAQIARAIAQAIQDHLAVNVTLRHICELGWNPEYDVAPGPEGGQ